MTSNADEFTRHCIELLSPLGPVRSRRMFGGRGLYIDEVFVAIIAGEQLYLKTDAQSRPAFEAVGAAPFRFVKEGESISTAYLQPPEEAMESPALMQPWARLALQAALRAQAAKASKPLKPSRGPRKPAATRKQP
jgi:DNA transformation protein and related proteins